MLQSNRILEDSHSGDVHSISIAHTKKSQLSTNPCFMEAHLLHSLTIPAQSTPKAHGGAVLFCMNTWLMDRDSPRTCDKWNNLKQSEIERNQLTRS
jgi:hypothetical protein